LASLNMMDMHAIISKNVDQFTINIQLQCNKQALGPL